MNWVMKMPDYKELYFKMFRASEEAIRRLVAVRQECEERYLSSQEAENEAVPSEQKASGE